MGRSSLTQRCRRSWNGRARASSTRANPTDRSSSSRFAMRVARARLSPLISQNSPERRTQLRRSKDRSLISLLATRRRVTRTIPRLRRYARATKRSCACFRRGFVTRGCTDSERSRFSVTSPASMARETSLASKPLQSRPKFSLRYRNESVPTHLTISKDDESQ